MNPHQLKRLFPHVSKSVLRANQDNPDDPGSSKESEQVDQTRFSETCGSEEMGAQYRLCRVEIEFYTKHAVKLDEDNRRYVAKPILDALVNLGFASDDKDITTETTQRVGKANSDI